MQLFSQAEAYDVSNCTQASWGWNVAGAAGGAAAGAAASGGAAAARGCFVGLSVVGWFSPCARANNEVMECFTTCAVNPRHNQNDPEWYCARQGRFIRIGNPVPPNDFLDLAAATRACAN